MALRMVACINVTVKGEGILMPLFQVHGVHGVEVEDLRV
jgi:polygalacturonase